MPGLSYQHDSTDGYRFGFNNQEKNAELGDYYAFEYRVHDARLGRFLSVDPYAAKFAYESNYVFVSNSPLIYVDKQGQSRWKVTEYYDSKGTYLGKTVRLVNTSDLVYGGKSGTGSDGMGGSTVSMNLWHDVNDVYKMVVNDDGSYTETLTKANSVGEMRAKTLFKWKWFANEFIREEMPEEEKMDEWGFVGIRWTSADGSTSGNDNSKSIYLRSENVDALIAAVGMVISAGKAKGLGIPTSDPAEISGDILSLFKYLHKDEKSAEELANEISDLYHNYKNLRDCRIEQRERLLNYPEGLIYQCSRCSNYFEITHNHKDESGYEYHHGNYVSPSENLKNVPTHDPAKIPSPRDCDKE